MADRYYRVALGGDLSENVTEGATATPTAFVDVRVTYDAPHASKEQVYKALNAVRYYILEKSWPA